MTWSGRCGLGLAETPRATSMAPPAPHDRDSGSIGAHRGRGRSPWPQYGGGRLWLPSGEALLRGPDRTARGFRGYHAVRLGQRAGIPSILRHYSTRYKPDPSSDALVAGLAGARVKSSEGRTRSDPEAAANTMTAATAVPGELEYGHFIALQPVPARRPAGRRLCEDSPAFRWC
jgi:hypothetical protein